jgi:hypothetical protein
MQRAAHVDPSRVWGSSDAPAAKGERLRHGPNCGTRSYARCSSRQARDGSGKNVAHRAAAWSGVQPCVQVIKQCLRLQMSRGGYFRVALVCVDGAVRMTEGEGSKGKVARFCAFV